MRHYNFGWNFAYYLANVRYNYIKTKNKTSLKQIKKRGTGLCRAPLQKTNTFKINSQSGRWKLVRKLKIHPSGTAMQKYPPLFQLPNWGTLQLVVYTCGVDFSFFGNNHRDSGVLLRHFGVLFKKNLPFLENPYPAISLFGLQNYHCKV